MQPTRSQLDQPHSTGSKASVRTHAKPKAATTEPMSRPEPELERVKQFFQDLRVPYAA